MNLLAATQTLPGVHPIPIGNMAANVVRLLLMVMEAGLLGRILFGLLDKRSFMHYLPWERRVAWLCVLTFVLRNLVVQIEIFNTPVTYEGAPLTFLALAFGYVAVRQVRVPVHIREPQPIPELAGKEAPRNRRATDRDARAAAGLPAAR